MQFYNPHNNEIITKVFTIWECADFSKIYESGLLTSLLKWTIRTVNLVGIIAGEWRRHLPNVV